MSEGRGGLLSAGGILSIIVGALEVLGGGMLVTVTMLGCWPFGIMRGPYLPGLEMGLSPELGPFGLCAMASLWMTILGGVFVALGIIAIAGGVSALRRKRFGLALAGAICTLPSVVLGILAIVFVALGKTEFEAEY